MPAQRAGAAAPALVPLAIERRCQRARVAATQVVFLARGAQLFEREQARRLEQAVARLAGFVRASSASTVTSERSTSAPSASSTAHSSSSPCSSATTCWISSSDALPANTPRRRNTARSRSSSKPWLHSSAARSVCWRAGAARSRLRGEQLAAGRASTRASRCTPSSGARAAASSIASARPSSCAAELDHRRRVGVGEARSVRRPPARRSTNSATAPKSVRLRAGSGPCGTASGPSAVHALGRQLAAAPGW